MTCPCYDEDGFLKKRCPEPRASKDTVEILRALQAAYPHAVTPEHVALHDLLGATNERITAQAAALLRKGDAAMLGD